MSQRTVKAQLSVFGVIALLIITYTVFNLLGLRLTSQPFYVTVQLPTGGGVFKGSAVTYRGVAVGRVSDVRLATTRVTVKLQLRQGTRVPANATANVYDLSAVGEQYIDLIPTSPDGAFLRGGDVIPATRTTTPLRTAQVLYDIGQFVNSISPGDIRILGREGAAALAGSAPALRSAINDLSDLVSQLSTAEPATISLIQNGSTLLHGAAAHTSDFDLFTKSLNSLTDSIVKTTPAINLLLRDSASNTSLINNLITTTGPSIDVLLANLATLSQIQVARVPALRALLVAVPEFGLKAPLIVRNGTLLGIVNVNGTQPICNTGVPLTSPISGIRTKQQAVSCPGSLLPRGAANAPRPGDGTSTISARELGGSPADYAVGAYDPSTGLTTTGDGSLTRLGGTGGQSEYLGHDSWKSALLALTGS